LGRRPPLDPELQPMVDAFPPLDLSPSGLNSSRETLAGLLAALDPGEAASREVAVPSLDGGPDVRLSIVSPARPAAIRPAIYFLHGGGMMMGSASQSRGQHWRLANEHDALVVSVDYRLAPETAYPGQLQDCHAGAQWLFAQAATLGVDPQRIVVMGESAGGGLAALLGLLARDRGEFQFRAQFLIYPMLDHRTGGPNDPYGNATTGHMIWSRTSNQYGWMAMQGHYDLADVHLGYFSASRAGNLCGLPPTFCCVGALDLFLDECMEFACRLSRASVPIEMHMYPGAVHGFDLMPNARVSIAAKNDCAHALRSALGVSPNNMHDSSHDTGR
jgi:acetyl esterase